MRSSLNRILFVLISGLIAVASGACGGDPVASPTVGAPPTATQTAIPTKVPTVRHTATVPAVPSPTTSATVERSPASSPTPGITSPAPTARPVEPTPDATAVPSPTVVRVSRSTRDRETDPDVAAADLAALVGGNNAFAFDLYRALAGSEGNLFFSPHSISTALAMAYAGARGETELQMAATLRYGLAQASLHPAFNALDLYLAPQSTANGAEEFRLSVANSVWGQEDYGFLPEYLDTLAANYGDEVRPVDFQRDPEDARVRINDWIADKTEERINDIIPDGAITPLTRLVLANAIYFKAAWQKAFDERATADRPFHLLDGSERDVPMMRQQSTLRYARGDGYQAVELPYVGGDVAMAILVPDSGRFHEFEDSLSGQSVRTILDRLDYELVRLALPRFETESAFSLSDTLNAMGMPDAFDDQAADFSGMDGRSCLARGDICLLISDVLHKAFVSVDESGTEAAAATAVIISTTRAVVEEPEPIVLTIDRPFIFLIRDRGTGATLFAGRVMKP